MADELTTSALAIRYATDNNDGPDLAAGIADMAGDIDAAIRLTSMDLLQPGVVGGAGVVVGAAVAGGGGVSFTSLASGGAWIALASGAIVRNTVPTGAFSATPGSLPSAGPPPKYAVIGLDLVGVPGGPATVALSSKGADQTTEALAIANPPVTASGRLRIMDLVVLNTAGVYSLVSSHDRRPDALLADYTPLAVNANHVAASGELVEVIAAGITVTLPVPTFGARVKVWNATGPTAASPTTISSTTNGGSLYGGGLGGVTSFVIGTLGGFAELIADVAGNWMVVSGGPDTGWVPLTLAAGIGATAGYYTPSVRLTADGLVHFKGALQNTSGSSMPPGTTLATIPSGPAGLRPTIALLVLIAYAQAVGPTGLDISTGGIMAMPSASLGSTDSLYLDPVAPFATA